MALLLVFVGARLFSGSDAAPGLSRMSGQLTPEEVKALGIAGDTRATQIATLVAPGQLPHRAAGFALSDMPAQGAENEHLRTREVRSTSIPERPRQRTPPPGTGADPEPPATGGRRKGLMQGIATWTDCQPGAMPPTCTDRPWTGRACRRVSSGWRHALDQTGPDRAVRAAALAAFPSSFGPASPGCRPRRKPSATGQLQTAAHRAVCTVPPMPR